MFTGLITCVGLGVSAEPFATGAEFGKRVRVAANAAWLADVQLGDSICVQGACMTVVGKDDASFSFDISAESLRLTSGLDKPQRLNLEKSLAVGDRLGGHIVSGHVDGMGQVSSFAQVGESWELRIVAPRALAHFLAYKGSVTVNGVSLTVNRVTDAPEHAEFSINIIPHTLANTSLGELKAGAAVNLEIDTVARYVERMLSLKTHN
jgi:riboflavin synthase